QVIANNDTAVTRQGMPIAIDVLSNDTGNIDNTKVNIVSQPVYVGGDKIGQGAGALQVSNNGVITYIPVGSYDVLVNDIVEFAYRVGDHSNPVQYSAQATVTITVTPSYYNPCDEATRAKIYYMPFPEHQDYLLTALRYASRAAGST